MDNMDSIWVEDHQRDKLYTAHPNMEMLNSDTPYLQSNTLELPPLPPTSYFTTLMAQQQEEEERLRLQKKKSGGKLLNAFMSSFKTDKAQKEKQRHRAKISTPFGFSHISHIDKNTTITNKTFEIHVPRHSVVDDAYNTRFSQHSPTASMAGPTTQAVAYNRTEPAARHYSTSSTLPRSSSLANSLSSHTFSTTRASISTTATSTRAISRKNTQSHHHTVSSSSIEQLSKLEKYQISKQCAPEYKSTRTSASSPTSTPSLKNKDSMNWDTPSPGNAVRQSWIYSMDHESPVYEKQKSKKLYATENAMIRESMLLMNMNTPLKEHIDRFTNTLNTSFDEGPEFAEIEKSMKELSVMFGVNDSPRAEGEVQEAMASMRAAQFTRISRDLMKDLGEGGMSEFKDRLDNVLKLTHVENDDDEDQTDFDDAVEVSTISSEDFGPSLL